MKSRNDPKLPLVLFLVFLLIFLLTGVATAEGIDDGKRQKPPAEANGGPGDHGGGDPDNPVPILGGSGGNGEQDACHWSVYIGIGGGSGTVTCGDLLWLVQTAAGALDKVLFL